MKTKLLFLFSAIIIIIGLVFLMQRNDDFDLAKREILIRKAGHEILLFSGDSTSRLLPVKKLADEAYQLQFEKEFTFEPDALVAIVRKSLASTAASNYIVTVLNCSDKQVVYGYTVSNQKKNDVIPCLGRKQPSNCYLINIEFEKKQWQGEKYVVLLLVLIGTILFCYFIFRTKKVKIQPIKTSHLIPIGALHFDKEKKCLITTDGVINLTAKENKLLLIFAQNPNETIDRTRLQKEIWEDDGIIVGRSLDVFISKLRKKLESDPKVQLINVHGKGYKLLIDHPNS